jgi:DNA-binding LacI/PurR family transcriptional regulator
VFCGNDTMALGVIRALTERGVRVPGDVSVIGFDDVPEAGYYLPPLTTVRQDFGTLGVLALNTLMDLIKRGGEAQSALPLAPDLIVRASSGPAPG